MTKQLEDYPELHEKYMQTIRHPMSPSIRPERCIKGLLLELAQQLESKGKEVKQLEKNKQCLVETNRFMQSEIDEFKRNRFVTFNEDECLPWCEDNKDLENISCPIVISPSELKGILDENESLAQQLEQANERVKKLESGFDECSELILDCFGKHPLPCDGMLYVPSHKYNKLAKKLNELNKESN